MSDFRSDPSFISILYVCEQRRLWRDCTDAYVISTIISWAGTFGYNIITCSMWNDTNFKWNVRRIETKSRIVQWTTIQIVESHSNVRFKAIQMVDRQGDWHKRMYYSYPFYRPLGMYLPTKVSGVSTGKSYASLLTLNWNCLHKLQWFPHELGGNCLQNYHLGR